MAPEDQLACTETLYRPSWVGDRRIDSRDTRMMVHEAFKTARMDRPGDTAIANYRLVGRACVAYRSTGHLSHFRQAHVEFDGPQRRKCIGQIKLNDA
jgi:hypothetical protein